PHRRRPRCHRAAEKRNKLPSLHDGPLLIFLPSGPGAAYYFTVQMRTPCLHAGHSVLVSFDGTSVLQSFRHFACPRDYDVRHEPTLTVFRVSGAPISLLATTAAILYAGKTVPARDLRELIAWLRANPNKASAGVPIASYHLLTAFFQKETATQFTLVPYRGAAIAMQDLVAGQIDLLFNTPDVLPLVRAGSIKAYATASDTRFALTPDIPTFAEMGLPTVSYSAGGDFSRPRARRGTSSASSMRRSWRHWPIRWCNPVSSISEWTFFRGTSKRRRLSARALRPTPRNGGRSSRSSGSGWNEKAFSGL